MEQHESNLPNQNDSQKNNADLEPDQDAGENVIQESTESESDSYSTADTVESHHIVVKDDRECENDKYSDSKFTQIDGGVENNGYVNSQAAIIMMKEEDPNVTAQDQEEVKVQGILCCKRPADAQEEVEKVGFFQLFRYADKLDILLMLVGSFFMMACGAAVPANLYFFGDLITRMVTFDTPRSGINNTEMLSQCASDRIERMAGKGVSTSEDILDLIVNTYVVAFVSIGVALLFVSYLGMSFWVWTGERQIRRIRMAYFNAIMRQSISWFDLHDSGELNSHLIEDMARLQEGFGDKMATFIQWFSTFLGGYAIGFVSSWKLTLAVVAMCPLMVVVAAVLGRFMRTFVRRELQAYAKAGAVAEETFSSIRTVAAFGGEKKAVDRFTENLSAVFKEGVRKGTVGGATFGAFWLVIFSTFALAFWYGAKLSRDDCLDPGALLQVFFGVLIGSINLGNAAPLLENFANARAAAAILFKSIDAEVEIDSSSDEGLKLDKLDGNIEFADVDFSYPARKEAQVLRGLNFCVKKGETVALVGESGCGKSTTIQLLQRFYECSAGKVLVDGKDLKDYNITWLRNYMGIVSQEPVLFATTIAQNIKLGSEWGKEVTQKQVEAAAREANCYDFIVKLPLGFETLVGDRGIQLSGGQKQRIAIARALVRNPAILLLDEATSALDTQSEAVVQEALDKASKGRTTIVIAHRLSTVKGANKIFAFKEGRIHEQGTHGELMSQKGIYYSLVLRQQQQQEEEREEHEKEVKRHKILHSVSHESADGYLALPASPTHPYSPNSPDPIERSSSIRRSKRLGSMRSLRSELSDGYMLGIDASVVKQEVDEYELEDGVVVAKRLISHEDSEEEADISFVEILKMNRPEWHLILIGSLAAMVTGAIQPMFAVLMSEIVGTFSEPNPEVQKVKVAKFVGYIMLVAVGAALATLLQNALFAISGERLTMRLRKMSFAAIISQEISYFDEKSNGVGYLTSRLASQASLIKGATGIRIGIIVQGTTTLLAALAISFGFVWELTLVVLLFMPIMMLAGKVQHRLITGHSKANKQSIEEGGQMAQEAISNMRTVTSLNRQRYFADNFYQHFKILYKEDVKKAFTEGVAYGVSQCMPFFMYAVCFGFGSYLIVCDCLPWRSERIPFFHILRVFATTTFGSMAVGRTTSQLPDFTKAKLAASNIKKLLERVSAVDPTSITGEQPSSCEGTVEFKNVEFHYPSRKTAPVLQGLNFTIKQGETLALVGSSGCGKSTSVSLLERFYNVVCGYVCIDGVDVQKLNVSWLRKNLGLVSQEPTLFDASIAYNIAYGDNDREVAMTEIIEAATQANAHNFITSLPQGYETNVGAKGTQLSGGQKQRIAIARALVRNPAVLLLDEATSALDTQSEKIVQEALEKAMVGRTSIVIAHRLSTIRNANKIGVIDSGKIVEVGTHKELLAKKGFYFNLVNAQL